MVVFIFDRFRNAPQMEPPRMQADRPEKRHQLVFWWIFCFIVIFLFGTVSLYCSYEIPLSFADMGSGEKRLIMLRTLLFLLSASFALGISWAMSLYLYLFKASRFQMLASSMVVKKTVEEVREHDSEQDQEDDSEDDADLHFHTLAEEHRLWSELWFTISVCVFIGGVIFAIVRFMWGYNPFLEGSSKITEWEDVASTFIEELFRFSMFYIAWNWAVRHFRAHWHNFILNAYRYRALRVLRNIKGEDKRTAPEIRKLIGLLLLMTESSAYLDTGQEPSMVERISSLDELTKKLVTGAETSQRPS